MLVDELQSRLAAQGLTRFRIFKPKRGSMAA